jgi:hypothetical protein
MKLATTLNVPVFLSSALLLLGTASPRLVQGRRNAATDWTTSPARGSNPTARQSPVDAPLPRLS